MLTYPKKKKRKEGKVNKLKLSIVRRMRYCDFNWHAAQDML
uniref:Uncharacterized protein n=1 Tax=Rhizophora mucronata TaxID=61149 RepID=A0A2P2P6I2_RHIMU